MGIGIRWDRDIPNELLYLPICSYVLNNPGKPFYIQCKSDQACLLMKYFIERLNVDSAVREQIYIVLGTTDAEAAQHNIHYLSSNSIILKPIDQPSIHGHSLTSIKSDLFNEIHKNNLQQLIYFIEENDIEILTWEENKWDSFHCAYEANDTPISYFWKKYVQPLLTEKVTPCFSFCLYGSNEKYLQGFKQNMPLIRKYFPQFGIMLWIRSDSVAQILSKIHEYIDNKYLIFEITNSSEICMMRYRIFSINHWYPTEVYSRDADSRLGERDYECIEIFKKSDKLFHIIRDHYWHKSRVMGGTCGIRKKDGFLMPSFYKLFNEWAQTNTVNNYATDEKFLQEVVYPYFKDRDSIFIQSNIIAYNDEIVCPINHQLNKDGTDFIGNSYSAQDIPEFKYWEFPFDRHFQWLKSLDSGKPNNEHCFIEITKNPAIMEQILKDKDMLSRLIRNKIYEGNLERARELFSEFEWIPTVDENVLRTLVVPYFKKFQESGGRVILTTDGVRTRTSSTSIDSQTAVVIIGDYPFGVWNLPCRVTKPLRFPVIFYNLIQGPQVSWEYERCWEPIKKIYVLNLEERFDRWTSTLSELARLGAPLTRIFHYKAKKADPATKLEIYWGATKNHVDCVRDFVESGEDYCLVLEDDIQFCSDVELCREELTRFFERDYDFDICMISYSKIGPVEPGDDCIMISKQPCTTSSGYILRKETGGKILHVLEEGLNKMRETGDYITFCCDRYWSKIQGQRKFFLLRNKIAYQRIVYSNITGCNNLFLD